VTAPTASVAIIGGGFTGAAVAFHLAHLAPDASILVFEPRASLGRGLAYDDPDPTHRINVPAAKMSLIPGDERHFARWVAAQGAASDDPEAHAGPEDIYPRRTVFGRYVAEQVAPLVAQGNIRHVRERVVSISREGETWRLTTDKGQTYHTTVAVLATTHPQPEAPAQLAAIASDPRVIADPFDPEALPRISPDARILIVGTGLTMADVVASLERAGHRGYITAISRRGLRSHGHPTAAAEPYGTFTALSGRRTPSHLVHHIREIVRAASAEGISWHAVLDAVRRDAPSLWAALTVRDRRRIVRHLRVFWDVHRFRIAPQVEAVLDRRLSEGMLEIVAASIRGATAAPDGLHLDITRRRPLGPEHLIFDHVVVCTGPAHRQIVASLPYLANLAREGWIVSDPLRLGIFCDRESRAVDNAGEPVATLFIAGPLARATFGELMGVPEVAAHALRLAEAVSGELRTGKARAPQRTNRIAN
jgi:uncharacterized NAD(P)/FAD-binding protein YdhS